MGHKYFEKVVYTVDGLNDLRTCLYLIQTNPITNKGICYNLRRGSARWEYCNLAGKLMKLWPEYSRNPYYPVPHQRTDPRRAYHNAHERQTLWIGKYGESRKRLLQWLIEAVEQMIECLLEDIEDADDDY